MTAPWRALAWELTGTFFLCFVITAGAHNTGASTPALPLAIGWTLAVMVYAGGPVSGKEPTISLRQP
jgi:glycerol uptake facilitator-like aquaporin